MAYLRVKIDEVRNLASSILRSRGFPDEEIGIIRECLMYAELRDNNQDFQKLKDIAYAPKGPIEVVCETDVACTLNANYNHAMVALAKASELAVKKAKKCGVGMVGINHTNSSSGAIGYFTSKIAREQQLIALLTAATPAMVAPYGGKEARIGTNPISVAFPSECDPIVFDATTAQWALYALTAAARQNEAIPLGVALDKNGEPTTDAEEALQGAILPKGVFGSGLGVVVHLVAGLLVGAFENPGDKDNWGHLLIVLDPAIFGKQETFLQRISRFAEWVKTAEKQKEFVEIYLPGERGSKKAREYLRAGSISIDDTLYNDLVRLAAE